MFVTHRFELKESAVNEIRSLSPNFGFNGFGEFIFYRTYSRFIESENRQETWHDCVIRVVNGIFSIRKDWYIKNSILWDEDYWQVYARGLAISMFNMEWLPPGRGLWAMGTDFVFERGSMALNNCGFCLIGDNIGADIHWIMDALMCGVGVGFNPIKNDDLVIYRPTTTTPHVIPDTREGWCDSVEALINSYLYENTPKPIFDYSLVRPAGVPIRGFGGVSSGPEPLKIFHQQIESFLNRYIDDETYNSVLLKADIANCTGCCVVAGNVRRSAELLTGSFDDVVDLKNYDKYPYREAHGWMSNNSVLLLTDEDFERLGEMAERIIQNGEPGYINRVTMPYGRLGKRDDVKPDKAIGFNPCQPGWAKLLTRDGIRNLKDCPIGTEIWSESGWTKIANKWSTGVNQVFAYRTTAGTFYGTEGHRLVYDGIKVEAHSAPGIDILAGRKPEEFQVDYQAVLDGLLIGDGTDYHGQVPLCIGQDDQELFTSEVGHLIGPETSKPGAYEVVTTITHLPPVWERTVPDRYYYGNQAEVCGFLRGLFSANGSIVANRVQLKSTSFRLIEQVQTMLSSVGIRSYYTTNKPATVQHRNGIYTSKQSYDLAIAVDRELFAKLIGFIHQHKTEALLESVERIKPGKCKTTYEIIEIELVSEEETFDITVENAIHTYWTQGCNVSNCGEQPLEDKELCTLVETLPTRCENTDTWLKACEYATFYASTVTLLPTHRPETNAVMLRNRRIGVGIIDVCGWEAEIGTTYLTKALRAGYKRVRNWNRWFAEEAGIPESIRVTTIKPGGTVPKLAGVRAGWQWPTFGKMIRRVRVARNQPVHSLLVEAGVPYEADVFSMNTDVFEWPIDQGDEGLVKPATEISLWRQAMMLVLLQREWSDNAVSNTLYFRPKWNLVKDLLIGEDFHSTPSEEILNLVPFDWEDMLDSQDVVYGKFRYHIVQDQYTTSWKLKLYEYDPKHEEDDVESVLATIAPLTKSVSMLPHATVGVYRQMPEEGCSDIEYKKRLLNLQKIDWSRLKQSAGVDEKYCEGPSCEIPQV